MTFEQYVESYKNEPYWMPVPTLEEYNKIQEDCLLAEFLGYKEYSNVICRRYDESVDDYYDDLCEYGVYSKYEPLADIPFYESDVLMFDGMNWLDWNHLMMVVDKIRSYPSVNDMEEGSIAVERFEISRTGMVLEYSKITDGKTCIGQSIHTYIPSNPHPNHSKSYIEAIYECCLDFVKFVGK